MAQSLNISILTNPGSWMYKYDIILQKELESLGCNVKILHRKDEITSSDILFLLSCFELVSQYYLSLNHHNIVVHASKLPHGKGWSPMTWQILEGGNSIPITLFEATNDVDAGQIYLTDEIELDGTELIEEWQNKLGEKIIAMCIKYVKNYNDIIGKEQTGADSFYRRRKPEDSELDPALSLNDQFNLLRVVDNENYPAFFIKNGFKYVIKIYKDGYNT